MAFYTPTSPLSQDPRSSRYPLQSSYGGTDANLRPTVPLGRATLTDSPYARTTDVYPSTPFWDQNLNPRQSSRADNRPYVHYPSELGATTDDDDRGTERVGATDPGAEGIFVDADADGNTDAEEEKFSSVDPFASSSHKRLLPKLSWNATPAIPSTPLPDSLTPPPTPGPFASTPGQALPQFIPLSSGPPRAPFLSRMIPAQMQMPVPMVNGFPLRDFSVWTSHTVPPLPPHLASPAPPAFSVSRPTSVHQPSFPPSVLASPSHSSPVGLDDSSIIIQAPSPVPVIPAILHPNPDPAPNVTNTFATLISIYKSILFVVAKRLSDNFFSLSFLQQLYLLVLLRLPRLYHSRVIRVFRDADISMKDIYQMWTFPTQWKEGSHGDARRGLRGDWVIFDHGNRKSYGSRDGSNDGEADGNRSNGSASGKVKVSSELLQFKISWEKFIDDLLREWNTSNIISGLILPAILTLLQIETAGSDPVIRTPALLSFVCAIMSLLYGCISIVRFGSMRKMHKAAAWSAEARRRDTLIWWNPWIMLAMPAVWLAWSLLLFLTSVMAFAWRTVSTTLDTSDSSNDVTAFLLKLANISSESTPKFSARTLLTLANISDPLDADVITPLPFTEIFRIVISSILGLGILYLIAMGRTFASYGDALDELFEAAADKWHREREETIKEREETSSHQRRRSSGRSASVYSNVEGALGPTRSRSRQSHKASSSSRPFTAPPADTPRPSTPFVRPPITSPESAPSPTTLNNGRPTFDQYSPSQPVIPLPLTQYPPSSRTFSRTSRRARSRRRSRINLSPPDSDPESEPSSFGDPRDRYERGRTPITFQGSMRFGNANTTVDLHPNSPFRTTKIWDSTRTVPPRNLQDLPTVLRFRNGLRASWHNFFTDLIDAWSNPPDYSIPEAVLWRCVNVWNEQVFELNKIRAVLCVESPHLGSLLDPPDGLLQLAPSSRLAVYLLDVSNAPSSTRSELAISDLKEMLLPLPPRLERMEVYISKPPGVPMPRVYAEATTMLSESTRSALNGHRDDTEQQRPHDNDDNQNQPAQPDFILASADYPLYDTSGSLQPRTPQTTSIPTPLPSSPAASTSTPRYELPPIEAYMNPPITLLNFQSRVEDGRDNRESTSGPFLDTTSEGRGALPLPSRDTNSAGPSTRLLRGPDPRRVRFLLDFPELDVPTQRHTGGNTDIGETQISLRDRVGYESGPDFSTPTAVTRTSLRSSRPDVPEPTAPDEEAIGTGIKLDSREEDAVDLAGPSNSSTPSISITPIAHPMVLDDFQPSVQPSPSLFRPAPSPENIRRQYASSFGSTNNTVPATTRPIRLVVFQNRLINPSTPEELSALLDIGLPGGDVRDITVDDWRDFIQRLCRLWEGDTRYLPIDNPSVSPSPSSPSSNLSSLSSYTHSCPEDYVFDFLQLWNRSFFSMRGVQVMLCEEYPKTLPGSRSESDEARYAVYVLDVLFEDPVTVTNSIASLFRPVFEDLHEIRLINQRPPSISRAEGRPLGTLLES